MGNYILKRFVAGVAMLLALSVLIFVLLNLAPGDPIYAYINPSASITEADLQELRHRIGLDRPLPVQYFSWLGNILKGQMGYSVRNNFMPVRDLVAERIGPTLLLMGAGMVVAIFLGMAAGVVAAVRKGRAVDYLLAVLAFLGLSSPAFLTSLVGLFLFSVYWRVAPSGGMTTAGAAFSYGDVLRHLILPAGILAIAQAAMIMRYMRSSMLESLTQDYIRTARAKGVPEFWVVAKHALRNSLLPVITLIGANLGSAVGGAIFVESVFSWPGMGMFLISSVEGRDYPAIMAIAMIIGVCVLVANLLTDIAYAVADPRIKLGGKA